MPYVTSRNPAVQMRLLTHRALGEFEMKGEEGKVGINCTRRAYSLFVPCVALNREHLGIQALPSMVAIQRGNPGNLARFLLNVFSLFIFRARPSVHWSPVPEDLRRRSDR